MCVLSIWHLVVLSVYKVDQETLTFLRFWVTLSTSSAPVLTASLHFLYRHFWCSPSLTWLYLFEQFIQQACLLAGIVHLPRKVPTQSLRHVPQKQPPLFQLLLFPSGGTCVAILAFLDALSNSEPPKLRAILRSSKPQLYLCLQLAELSEAQGLQGTLELTLCFHLSASADWQEIHLLILCFIFEHKPL